MAQHIIPIRYKLAYDGACLHVTIPNRKQWLYLIMLGGWNAAWFVFTLGVLFATTVPFILGMYKEGRVQSEMLGPGIVSVILVIVWFGFGAYSFYRLLWELIGREIIEIDRVSIRIRRSVFGFEKSETYSAAYIKDLRYSPYMPQIGWAGLNPRAFWSSIGVLVFDCGPQTVRFGDLDKAEAILALADINQYFPEYIDQKNMPE